ncbi:class I SAM-dependent methyltransferase [Stappia sp. BW2]|uniref:class I SAM-dependent methyltransferase n=1 Tax=Stappia sp. BW2 TaxID=2592622 RepID=UPI0011DED3AD|nr:class I SAM-dependent methyltransferase [Stappia sp. BW2]TYC65134.1 class I SAM-dependent methyltransferase [Stappia sp. BW2]
MNDKSRNEEVQRHYATPRHLVTRGSFQAKYATVSWFGWLIDHMNLQTAMEVLDVGSGPAWIWRSQFDRLPDDLRLSLIDTSQGMIEEALANLATLEKIEVVSAKVADAVTLPHPDETFDAVLLFHVLYHVDDPRSALREARRVLRPGGQVFVSTNALENMSELHTIGAEAFGGSPVDPGAALFSLDDAAQVVGDLFGSVRRFDLSDTMTCTDPKDAVTLLLSMPPGIAAPEAQQRHLAELIRKESDRLQGTLKTTRRNGLIVGTKAP